MHATNAEMIWVLICAIALVCFWRVILVLFLCVLVGTTLLGLATVLGYLGH